MLTTWHSPSCSERYRLPCHDPFAPVKLESKQRTRATRLSNRAVGNISGQDDDPALSEAGDQPSPNLLVAALNSSW